MTIHWPHLAVAISAAVFLSSCFTAPMRPAVPQREPRVPKPLVTDTDEVKWRMYYEDQFDAFGRAAPPAAGDPSVAWSAYYSEKQSSALRENTRILMEMQAQQQQQAQQ